MPPHYIPPLLRQLSVAFCVTTIALSSHVIAKEQAPLSVKSSTTEKTNNLLDRSTILVSSPYWTIVPKGSVIHVPKNLERKILQTPKGKFITYTKFLSRNSSWLYSYPIDLDYARGNKRFEKSRFDRIPQINKIVITTYKRGPITLHKNAYPLPEAQSTTTSN